MDDGKMESGNRFGIHDMRWKSITNLISNSNAWEASSMLPNDLNSTFRMASSLREVKW